MTDYLSLPLGDRAPDVVAAVIENPSRTRNKIEYDERLQVFRLDRTLLSPVVYPVEYGFFPSTRGGDGDALDVMVLAAEPLFPGCVLDVRPVACLELHDQAGEDTKVLAVVADDPRFEAIQDLDTVPASKRREIEEFYKTYAVLEGKKKRLRGWRKRAESLHLLRLAANRFLEG
ncbi:MAG TPA: inorganic diphosphatase [Planctomycetota bacterium]|nr:inorganic diphosphatase [Planctomycetota bacterium]